MLIRRQDAAMQAFRPFALPRSPTQTIRGPDENPDLADRSNGAASADPHETELARLRDRVKALEAALQDAATASEAAVEAALEKGRDEGRQAADELGAERL